jgi:hypothetical protein
LPSTSRASTPAAGDGSALAVGVDMAGDGIAVDAELGLDVRLVLAVQLLAVQLLAVDGVLVLAVDLDAWTSPTGLRQNPAICGDRRHSSSPGSPSTCRPATQWR